MDEALIFLINYQENPDYNEADSLAQMSDSLLRNQIITDIVNGNESADFLFDVIEKQGIDSTSYVEEVVENVDFLISNGLILPNTIWNGTDNS
jgi:hypothetical protein